ncbi:hypothetical protein PVAP13_3KG060754 [Panicum virgatum]|uniref:Uncharacterized protein n=1 Tax=Panicum virgatum TaxID=38727 RepID=A0A8T0ULK7_PANVG|nr:hypothetical protein PVAP13_3KG060754 [Panicum virgatum]
MTLRISASSPAAPVVEAAPASAASSRSRVRRQRQQRQRQCPPWSPSGARRWSINSSSSVRELLGSGGVGGSLVRNPGGPTSSAARAVTPGGVSGSCGGGGRWLASAGSRNWSFVGMALSGVFLGPPLGRRAAELQGERGGPWVWAGGCSVVAARPAAGTHSWAGASPVMLRARLSRRAASGDGHRPPASDAGGFGL